MAASETGFSCLRDIGTRRRCPPLSAERPKRHGHTRHAHRSTLCRVVGGYHPPHSSLSVPPVLRSRGKFSRPATGAQGFSELLPVPP